MQFETSFADGDKFLIDRLYDEDGFLYVDYSSLEEGTDEYSESTARLEDIMDEKQKKMSKKYILKKDRNF